MKINLYKTILLSLALQVFFSKSYSQVLDIEKINCRVSGGDMETIKKIAKFEKDLFNNLFNTKSNDSLLIKVKILGPVEYKAISQNAHALHKTWGFYSPYLDESFVLRNQKYLQTVIHEMSHCLLNHNLRNAPRWLNEGIADFCGSMLIEDDKVSFAADAYKIKTVKEMIIRSPLKLKDFMSIKDVEWTDPESRSSLYAISYSIVYFLIKKNPSTLKRVLLMMQEGQSAIDAIEYSYGGFYKFEDEFNAFYRNTLVKPI